MGTDSTKKGVGTLVPRENGWWLRLPKALAHLLKNEKRKGSRPLIRLDPSIPVDDAHRDEARRSADQVLSELGVDPDAKPMPAEAETIAAWFARWVADRDERKLRSTRDDRGRFNKWISPRIGHHLAAAVTRAQLESIVEDLDAAVRADRIRWKTANNVWGMVTKMFDDMVRSKRRDLRTREDNPAKDVRGPDGGAEREGPYLYPAEVAAILDSDRVPPRWKKLIVLSTYLYIRAGELEALDWSDVDLDKGVVRIHKATSRRTGVTGATKTKRNRLVPIESTLVPLFTALKEDAGGKGPVVKMPPHEDMPERLRQYVEWGCEDAGLDVRDELFANDETRRKLTWHDLRHTGITWRAIRGDEPLKIQRAAGHTTLGTTQRYINEAESFERPEVFGEVFPALPTTALPQSQTQSLVTARRAKPAVFSQTVASPAGFSGCGSFRASRDRQPH